MNDTEPDSTTEPDMEPDTEPGPGRTTIGEVILARAWQAHREALGALEGEVRRARDQGLNWAQIGRATGMTRQSARERWGTL